MGLRERIERMPMTSAGLGCPVVRVARATENLDRLLPFYRDGLGMEVLWRFEDHQGFDGLIVGWPGAPYHLEFTRKTDAVCRRALEPENLLVLYLPDRAQWEAALARFQADTASQMDAARADVQLGVQRWRHRQRN